MTVVYETTYTREEAFELLQLSGLDMAHVPDDPTNRQLAEILAVAANTESLTGYDELYTRLTDDAGDWVDATDIGEQIREVRIHGKVVRDRQTVLGEAHQSGPQRGHRGPAQVQRAGSFIS